MTRTQRLVLAVLVPVVVVAALVIGSMLAPGGRKDGIRMFDLSDETSFDYDYTIPPGTAERIDDGEDVEIVPRVLVVHIGDSIRIVNDDVEGHVVGVFYVGAGETLTKRFTAAGELSGECTVHPSGQFTLRVVA